MLKQCSKIISTLIIILVSISCREPELVKVPPTGRVLSNHELIDYLSGRWAKDQDLLGLSDMADSQAVLIALAAAIKAACATNYYFDWRKFDERFDQYSTSYGKAMERHGKLAKLHQSLYPPETSWQLPFTNEMGKSVTAYELRHLARQQKSLDMTLMYFSDAAHKGNLDYFVRQVADLNRAFAEGAYDDEGNSVYETFRAGKRIHNWLFNHHAYLAADDYSWQNQLLLVRTFIHHGAQLARRSGNYRPGNHHTKGLVALYEIAASLPMFSVAEQWRKQAVEGLLAHMDQEINADGFQFERSVHYHIGDLENYIRVYQLSQAGGYDLPPGFTESLEAMFDALVKIAKPDKSLPVEQDDTDTPYAISNDGGAIFAIAGALFGKPQYGYFADDTIPAKFYWLLSGKQLTGFGSLESVPPTVGSVALPQTGYYVLRNGWDSTDEYMIISAGLSDTKPDHQHGDMLGMYAYSRGHVILPNYQVTYNTPEYPIWKNSWVKNVALVDSIPQGRTWKGNRGGSGFGKWLDLPNPAVEVFFTDQLYDYFKGRHDGYDSIGVQYSREVLFLKEPGFWVVRDVFDSDATHRYQQIWQGDFERVSDGQLVRQLDAKGKLNIIQLGSHNYVVSQNFDQAKPSTVVESAHASDFVFTTFVGVSNGPLVDDQLDGSTRLMGYDGWTISAPRTNSLSMDGITVSGHNIVAVSNQDRHWLLGVEALAIGAVHTKYPQPVGIYIGGAGQALVELTNSN